MRRVGGGFGAKQMRSTYAAGGASLAAYHTQRPVKMCLTLQDNMQILGRRQPIRFDYQVGIMCMSSLTDVPLDCRTQRSSVIEVILTVFCWFHGLFVFFFFRIN